MSEIPQPKSSSVSNQYLKLSKLNAMLMKDIQMYKAALIKLKKWNETSLGEQDQDISPQQAEQLVQDMIKQPKISQSCDCERWKNLYISSSESNEKISKQYEQLNKKIIHMEEKNQADEIQVKKLLEDYLQLYRKNLLNIQNDRKQINKQRSNSKNKKKVTNLTNKKAQKAQQTDKQDNAHFLYFIEELKQQLGRLRKDIKQVRQELIEKNSIIRLYRQKQRQRILYSKYIAQ